MERIQFNEERLKKVEQDALKEKELARINKEKHDKVL